jgi:hypothetical protein
LGGRPRPPEPQLGVLPTDRARLKAALERRCADWRERLRSDHIEEARYVVQQLIGPLELWIGSRKESKEKEKPLAALGVTAGDSRGKENIEWSDCGYEGTLSPLGLLNGLCTLNVVAGLATGGTCNCGASRADAGHSGDRPAGPLRAPTVQLRPRRMPLPAAVSWRSAAVFPIRRDHAVDDPHARQTFPPPASSIAWATPCVNAAR